MPFRVFGITQSKMNPNICTLCERAFRRVKKRSHFTEDATILFSDVRGYTRLSEMLDPDRRVRGSAAAAGGLGRRRRGRRRRPA